MLLRYPKSKWKAYSIPTETDARFMTLRTHLPYAAETFATI
ncbi:hypothetical protein L494_0054 [Bordetella bronchiseptica CA90 BB1334]|uniref:Transposase n=1 Tax=Bordetella bronchiseptica 00-P-2796 TaxID=1331199 RepID=A0ABR4RL91_BORBO|nr:hypothetical protein L576_0077 [Bordetella bronchiseptica OSU054]KCV38320.1 hypothetical protein L490_5370 [Bordetella bronchiseptica 00-P-2796]KDB74214.1 hypothetical protein L494_0054 [Bordetella bronchiseptica CA90 BB1334]KDC17862.1 hypothetical protein L542_0075 [Bordetella bronchiseptica F-1]KDC24720.1 hypothetical protein L504_0077 [Bordetella bronchiseptica F2]KDD45470.1 hypothetical protein L532_5274 [Bordetella bronchiseptica OSU095]